MILSLAHKLSEDPEVRAALALVPRGTTKAARISSARLRLHYGDPANRAKQAEMQRKLWADPKHRAKMTARRRKIVAKKRWREKMEVRAWRSAQTKLKQSIAAKKRWKNPAYRARITAAVSAQMRDPQKKAACLAGLQRTRELRNPRYRRIE